MPETNFRALCVELVKLSAPTDSIAQLAERLQNLAELANRARAALERLEPGVEEGATNEELYQLAYSMPWGTELERHRRCYNLGRQHGAAILEVAAWLRTQDDLLLCYGLDWANRVEREANR
jgi:hypothetical protein